MHSLSSYQAPHMMGWARSHAPPDAADWLVLWDRSRNRLDANYVRVSGQERALAHVNRKTCDVPVASNEKNSTRAFTAASAIKFALDDVRKRRRRRL